MSYGYLTGSSNVNKATPFQARVRRSFGAKISRYERQMLAGKFREQSCNNLALRAYNRRSKQSVYGKCGLRVIRTRYSRVCHDKTTKLRRFRENSLSKSRIVQSAESMEFSPKHAKYKPSRLNKSICLKFFIKAIIQTLSNSIQCSLLTLMHHFANKNVTFYWKYM